jgi:hypothetical protein
MRIVDIIKKFVVFVGHSAVDGSFIADGTGFVILMRAHGFALPYAVTAKHVIDQAAGSETPPRDILIRINTRSGGIKYITTKLPRWHFHPDHVETGRKKNYIDVAAYSLCNMREWSSTDMEDADFSHMDENEICTANIIEEYTIGIGDEVVIPGLFLSHLGTLRNIPIVRHGNIAAMREEPVPTSKGMMDAYLVEMRSIGGISGSPVLLQMEGRAEILYPEAKHPISIKKSRKTHYLLGLVQGHYTITTQDEWVFKTDQPVGDINAGIAIVVPAEKIMETICQPSAFGQEEEMTRQHREAANARSRTVSASAPSRDSASSDDVNPHHLEDFKPIVDAAARKRPRDDQR